MDGMPDPGPAVNPSPRRFRMKLWPWLLFGWFAALLPAAAILAVLGVAGPQGRVPAGVIFIGFASGVAVAAPVLVLGMAAYVWWFRVTVKPAGLRGYDVWSVPLEVPWEDVSDIQPFSLCGLPFLLLSAHGRVRRLWLPLFLADYPGFVDAVADAAGDDHPLTVALRELLADD